MLISINFKLFLRFVRMELRKDKLYPSHSQKDEFDPMFEG